MNKSKKKGHKGNKNAKKQNSPKFSSKGVNKAIKGVSAYDPSQVLKNKDLQRAVRSLVRLETRPAIREYSRAIGQLKQSQNRDIQKAQLLGKQATGNIRSYYNQLGNQNVDALRGQQAAGARLTGAVSQQGVDTQQAIGSAGEAAQARTAQYQPDQNISARDQLAQLVAMQQGAAAREQAALNAQAQGQATGFEQLQRGLGQANQLTGAARVFDTQQSVLNQQSDIRDKYGQELMNLRGKRSDIIAQRPDLAAKAFSDLRESERNFLLSRAAIGEKKFEALLGAQQQSNTIGGYKQLAAQKAKNSREIIKLQARVNKGLATQKQKQRLQYLKAQQRAYGKGSGGGSKQSGGYQPLGKTFSYVMNSPVTPKMLVKGTDNLSSKQVRRKMYFKLRNYGASDKVARKAINKAIRLYKKSHRHGINVPGGGHIPTF